MWFKTKISPARLSELIVSYLWVPASTSSKDFLFLPNREYREKEASIFIELVAVRMFLFTAIFYKYSPNLEHSIKTYTLYGSMICKLMCEDKRFSFNYEKLARHFKKRGIEYLDTLNDSADDDYSPFTRLYMRNNHIAESYYEDQLHWLSTSAEEDKTCVEDLWTRFNQVEA